MVHIRWAALPSWCTVTARRADHTPCIHFWKVISSLGRQHSASPTHWDRCAEPPSGPSVHLYPVVPGYTCSLEEHFLPNIQEMHLNRKLFWHLICALWADVLHTDRHSLQGWGPRLLWAIIVIYHTGNRLLFLAIVLHKSAPEIASIVSGSPPVGRKIRASTVAKSAQKKSTKSKLPTTSFMIPVYLYDLMPPSPIITQNYARHCPFCLECCGGVLAHRTIHIHQSHCQFTFQP